MIHKLHKTIEGLQSQDVQAPMIEKVQKTVEFPQILMSSYRSM